MSFRKTPISNRLENQSFSPSPGRSPGLGRSAGPLNEDEIEDLREAFNLFDTEGTGRIDPRELCSAMQSLGIFMIYNRN